jgi:glucose-6-phosphate-specific signal transduction histidine kinase
VHLAQQLSKALQRKLDRQQVLAKELVHTEEELAANAPEVLENAEGAVSGSLPTITVLAFLTGFRTAI